MVWDRAALLLLIDGGSGQYGRRRAGSSTKEE